MPLNTAVKTYRVQWFFMSDDSDTNPMLSLANETKNDRELFPKKSIVEKYLLIMPYNKDFYPEI